MEVEINPYAVPTSPLIPESAHAPRRYVGFWLRVVASIVDSVLISLITIPILWRVYGASYFTAASFIAGPIDVLVSWAFLSVAIILFWLYRSATPGKLVVSARIVDAATGAAPNTGQCLIRYLGYFVSTIPLGMGLLWVAFDSQKQGWHDKLAGTVVVRNAGVVRG